MSTLREALTAAIDKGEIEVDESASPAEDGDAPEVEAAPADELEAIEDAPAADEAPAEEKQAKTREGRDEKGRFRGEKAPTPAGKPAADAAAKPVAAQAKPPATEQQPAAPAAAAVKPPQSWKAAAREKWATLPPDVQQEVARIDGEVRKVMQEAAGARQFAGAFQQTLAPYEAMIRAEQRGRNYNPIEVVGNLLGTAAALRTGAPAHKADLVAELIQTYGVDISQLDAALSKRMGGAPAAGPQGQTPAPTPQQQPYRDPRVDQLFEQIQHGQREAEQRVYQQGQTQVQQFAATHEFFEDVREAMGDLMAGATQRGREMSLEEAYRRACAADDQVSSALRQRQEAQAARERAAATKRARAASSSVRSNPTGGSSAPATDSRRSDLESAWEDVAGR